MGGSSVVVFPRDLLLIWCLIACYDSIWFMFRWACLMWFWFRFSFRGSAVVIYIITLNLMYVNLIFNLRQSYEKLFRTGVWNQNQFWFKAIWHKKSTFVQTLEKIAFHMVHSASKHALGLICFSLDWFSFPLQRFVLLWQKIFLPFLCFLIKIVN